MSRHQRRTVLLGAVAAMLAILGLADLGSGTRAAPAAARIAVLVARRPIAPGVRIAAGDLDVVRVSAGAVSPHQLRDASAAVGRRAAVALPPGSPIMDAELARLPVLRHARDVAVRLDDLAGAPAVDLAGTRADLYLTRAGRSPGAEPVVQGALVLSAQSRDGAWVATLRLPPAVVPVVIRAESLGTLRLVARPGAPAR